MVGKMLKKIKSDRNGSALVFTLLISSLLMIAALAIITVTKDDFQITAFRTESSQAKYVADSAIEIIKQQINDTEKIGGHLSVLRENNLTAAGGEYDYSVEPPPPEEPGEPYIINVWARVKLANGEVVQKNIEVEYEYNSGTEEPGGGGGTDPPPSSGKKALDFALFQGGGLGVLHLNAASFKGKGDVFSKSKIKLREDNPDSKPLLFEGTVCSSDDIDVIGNISSEITIKPKEADVPTPVVNWDYLVKSNPLTQREPRIYKGDKEFDLRRDVINDRDIIYVDGDLTLTGNLTENALFVATGNITVIGDFKYPNSDYKVAGIIAGKELILKAEETNPKKDTGEGPKIRGFAMAGKYGKAQNEGNVEIDGNVYVEGTLIASRDISFKSGVLEYITSDDKPAQEVLTLFGHQIFSDYSN